MGYEILEHRCKAYNEHPKCGERMSKHNGYTVKCCLSCEREYKCKDACMNNREQCGKYVESVTVIGSGIGNGFISDKIPAGNTVVTNYTVIGQYDPKTGEIVGAYERIQDAVERLGVRKMEVAACCRGKVATCDGYVWRHIDELDIDNDEVRKMVNKRKRISERSSAYYERNKGHISERKKDYYGRKKEAQNNA